MKNKKLSGLCLMLFGAVLILGALALTLYNLEENKRAEIASGTDLAILSAHIVQNTKENAPAPILPDMYEDEEIEVPEMAEDLINYRRYIGYIEIPSVNITLPVLRMCDEENLRVAPCVYSGSYYTDDLVIAGHNMASHFSALKNIAMGVDVILTTVDGSRLCYYTDNIETLKPGEVDYMKESSDLWDLTLFTCYTGGQTRCTVRCVREK